MTEHHRAMMDRFLGAYKGPTVMLKLSKPQSVRSLNANAFYWGVVISEIAQHTGHSAEEIHLAVKDLFLPRKFLKLGTREVEVRKTTTDLSPTEFSAYVEQVRAWAAQELGLTIPEPA